MIKGLGWPIEKYGLTSRWMGRLDSESVAFRELPVSLPLRRLPLRIGHSVHKFLSICALGCCSTSSLDGPNSIIRRSRDSTLGMRSVRSLTQRLSSGTPKQYVLPNLGRGAKPD